MTKAQSQLDSVVQYLIPPALILLLTVTIFDVFYDMSAYSLAIEIFDLLVITIFIIDLYYRYQEKPDFFYFIKTYWLDIIASIPFTLIFVGADYLALTQGLRGVRLVTRFARASRFIRLFRFATRLPRFMRLHKVNRQPHVVRKVQPHEKELKGVLSFKVVLLVTVNSIMGTGIYFLTAAGAKYAGPASLVAWGVLSLISLYISMCFGELVSMFPKAGGVYEFSKQTYGRFTSFVVGWTTAIAGNVTIAMLLLGALQYAIPLQYSAWYVPIAVGLIVLFNYIAYRGLQTSTVMLVTFALITIASITAVIVPGFFTFEFSNLDPFFVFPAMNIFLSIFFIAETFFGWESAIFLAAETKNPRKVMPKALILGTAIIATFAILLAFTSLGAIPWQEYGDSARPLTDLGGAYFGGVGATIFTVLVFISIIGAVASWIVTTPRLLMALAEDKLFFVQFAKVHPKHKSPYVSIGFQALLISFLVWVGSGSYTTLLHMLIPLILVIYSMVLLAVVVLRFKKPNLPRPFRAPFGMIGPFLTIAFMIFLLGMFIFETHDALDVLRVSASLVAFGVPAYFFIELFYDPKFVRLREDFSAWFAHHYHKSQFPKPTYDKILNRAGPFTKNTQVVEFHTGIGGLFQRINQKKLPFKHYFAVDQSKQAVKFFKERIPSEKKKKITVLYQKTFKVPEKAPKNIDVFMSINSLGIAPNIESFVENVGKRLKKGGTFCFFVKYHMFNISPNALELDDAKKIKKIFKGAGLKATYTKRKGFWSTHIFISGKK